MSSQFYLQGGTVAPEPLEESTGELKRATQHGDGLGLQERLSKLNLTSVEIKGDGNCQFRALAYSLWGDQDQHTAVRKASVRYLTKHADRFQAYFESTAEFYKYLLEMLKDGTWGDELTLSAAVQAYGCPVHVVTSESERWYLIYQPEDNFIIDHQIAVCPEGLSMPRSHIAFMSYISQKHYNALIPEPDESKLTSSVSSLSTTASLAASDRRPSTSTLATVNTVVSSIATVQLEHLQESTCKGLEQKAPTGMHEALAQPVHGPQGLHDHFGSLANVTKPTGHEEWDNRSTIASEGSTDDSASRCSQGDLSDGTLQR